VLDARGQFNATGVFVREHGGPVRLDEASDSHPANYAGTVTANAMVLTVRLSDLAETIGTFTLTMGAPGRVVKCLLNEGKIRRSSTRCVAEIGLGGHNR